MAIPGSGDVVLLYGQDSDGNLVPLRLNADGTLSSTSSSLELGSTPSTQAFGDAAAVGASVKAAPELHVHGMPANPVTAHVAAGDPHTQYALETVTPQLIQILSPTGTNVDFTSIPGTYRNLKVIWHARGDAAALSTLMNLTFNGDTGNNYDAIRVLIRNAANSITESFAGANIPVGLAIAATTANYIHSGEFLIANYAGTTFYKSVVGVGNYTNAVTTTNIGEMHATGWWRSTAAINRVTITLATGNFVADSTFELWGYP